MIADKEIINGVRRNPEQGYRQLMRQCREPVYWHIRRLVVLHEDAQDATQETFVRVFRSIDKFKGDCSLMAWIYRIATNEALRIIGRRCHVSSSLDDDDAEARHIAGDEYVDYADAEAVKLQKAILSLPTKQQLAFNMRYYDEMSYDDIAQVTGSTPSSVKANYHVAKEKITKFMNS